MYAIPYMSLDLTPGHGNLLGESYWEIRSPWLGGSWTLNTGVLPREERVSSLSLILEDSPPRKYYLSRKACLGILRRARERGKPLPPELEEALKAQAGLTVYLVPVQDPPLAFHMNQRDEAIDLGETAGALMATSNMQMQTFVTRKTMAFAQNQRDEVRDLHDVAGALSAQPGMKQQTFVSGCLTPWDTQQARITAPEGVSPTINSGEAKPGGLIFAAGFCAGAGPSAGSVGYQEEVAPTLKAAASGNMMPTVLCLNDQGGSVMECSEDVAGTLRAQEHGHQPLIYENTRHDAGSTVLCLNDQGGNRMDASVDVTGTLRAQMDGHPPCVVEPACAVYENHGIDSRYTGPHDVVPTISARAGTGGNNLHLVEVFSRQRVDMFLPNDVASTESARQHKDATDLIYQETVGTLTSSNCKGPNTQYVSQDKLVVEGPLLIRRLTPKECERLQGFPDDWTDLPGAADAPRYKALGNSVAIPCVEYLMLGMACVLRAEEQRAG